MKNIITEERKESSDSEDSDDSFQSFNAIGENDNEEQKLLISKEDLLDNGKRAKFSTSRGLTSEDERVLKFNSTDKDELEIFKATQLLHSVSLDISPDPNY